jgi:hypothetical protein
MSCGSCPLLSNRTPVGALGPLSVALGKVLLLLETETTGASSLS